LDDLGLGLVRSLGDWRIGFPDVRVCGGLLSDHGISHRPDHVREIVEHHIPLAQHQMMCAVRLRDSTAEPRLTRVKLHLFRKNAGDGSFSAVIDITDAPPAPKAADHTIAVQFHVPQGLAPGSVRAAKRAGKKKR
jgi:hypothetical protein